MKKRKELDRLLAEYGTCSRIADVFGLTHQAVSAWYRLNRKPSPEVAFRIQRINPSFSAEDLLLDR